MKTEIIFQDNQPKFNHKLEEQIYKLALQGIKLLNGPRLLGITDEEIQFHMKDYNVKASSLRYYRWRLVKAGHLKYAGFHRSFVRGKKRIKVWVINDDN